MAGWWWKPKASGERLPRKRRGVRQAVYIYWQGMNWNTENECLEYRKMSMRTASDQQVPTEGNGRFLLFLLFLFHKRALQQCFVVTESRHEHIINTNNLQNDGHNAPWWRQSFCWKWRSARTGPPPFCLCCWAVCLSKKVKWQCHFLYVETT